MHIVIVGAGRVGATLAGWLVSVGHEVAVIDEDRTRCASIDEALGSVSIVGDGTEPGVLIKAGANRADVLVAATGKDDVNLVACQLAKHRFEVLKTVAVVNVRDHANLFGLLGVDVTVDVAEIVLGRIQQALTSHGLVQLMPVSDRDGKVLVSIKIPTDSRTASRPLKDISIPDGTMISLVISSDGSASIPGENTLIQAGDAVVAVTTDEEDEELRDLLIEGPGE